MNSSEVSTNRQNMPLSEFLLISSVGNLDGSFEELFFELEKPDTFCGRKLPESLNDLSFGDLAKLQGMKDLKDMLFTPGKVLFRLNESLLLEEKAIVVLSFSSWIVKELKRINDLFASTHIPPTREEILAGVEKLNFGPFGTIDYYALRMGIKDHDEVMRIPWVRIYKCLDIDSQKAKYERKLREVYARKN